jgi:hypothetical protein
VRNTARLRQAEAEPTLRHLRQVAGVSALFEERGSYRYILPILDKPGWADVQQCLRCGVPVIDTAQHEKWHGSVDTNQTAKVE